jgi:hypothetical protein
MEDGKLVTLTCLGELVLTVEYRSLECCVRRRIEICELLFLGKNMASKPKLLTGY